ncbi:hypothetical protein ABZ318_17925 [Streptomyces sp. NPDC006197]|uniref:hypothetical protein n=1 Tax=Streptomyces sp. NPDC006197 TaxID=3156685 RepID=UPI0033A89BFF
MRQLPSLAFAAACPAPVAPPMPAYAAITSNDLEFKDGDLDTGPKDPLGRHERGHALGLCHKADAVISLMRKVAPSTGHEITWIPDTGKANYRRLWG